MIQFKLLKKMLKLLATSSHHSILTDYQSLKLLRSGRCDVILYNKIVYVWNIWKLHLPIHITGITMDRFGVQLNIFSLFSLYLTHYFLFFFLCNSSPAFTVLKKYSVLLYSFCRKFSYPFCIIFPYEVLGFSFLI